MGGHAFKSLHCPRISPGVYVKAKTIARAALQRVFAHVTVPCEVPGKADYGDVDFLVSAPIGHPAELNLTTFPFSTVIEKVRNALNTSHGRRGFLTPDCMYFAIALPSHLPTICLDDEDSDRCHEAWVQIDVKICFRPESFAWMTFELNFASQSSILGSMIKPLGLTLDPEGLHVRVEEVETTDRAGSMVWVTRDPWMVCRVLGLGRRVIDGGFESSEQIFEEYAGSWLFHPENFKAKLDDESYLVQHSHRAQFLKKWIPKHYPDYKLNAESKETLATWTARTRQMVQVNVFTRFPEVATEYYCKRLEHIKKVEERKLRELITAAIPACIEGWSDVFDLPPVIIKPTTLQQYPSMTKPQPALIRHGELTPPQSPVIKPVDLALTLPEGLSRSDSYDTPVHIDALPRQPPYSCKPGPPPPSMSASARLTCLARWTAFSATGVPYLLNTPHAKDFDLQWRDAIEAGFSETGLMKWAQELWWPVWVRQCVVNWRGMWAKRIEKEDAKAEKAKAAVEERARHERIEEDARIKAEEFVRAHKLKIMGRLKDVDRDLGGMGSSN